MRRRSGLRVALLALAGAGLVAGVWAGLVRAGWALPVSGVVSPAAHGTLMISGFFGALIALERAVALDRAWAYTAVPAAAVGALGGAVGLPGAGWWSVAAALVLTAASLALWRLQPSPFMAVMSAGAASWGVAAVLGAVGAGIAARVPWLAGFLVLVIVGERLELSRLSRPSRWKEPAFAAAAAVFLLGMASGVTGASGWRLLGMGLVLLSGWLAAFDVARHTVRMGGVTGFIGACLLAGYAWMALAGLWWLVGGDLRGSLGWDGALHALFVGFVVSMVFGHVHMVAPAVLGVTVPFRRRFWWHVVLLHGSLVLRVAGDLLADPGLRRLGSMGNALAILLFLVATAAAVRSGRIPRPGRSPKEVTS